MVTVAVPAPACAVTDPDDAVTADELLLLYPEAPVLSSDFLLEQPVKPATTIAALPTPTNKPRTTGVPFFAEAHVRGIRRQLTYR